MRFDIVTIFPAMITDALGAGVVGRAIARGTIEAVVDDLRGFTADRHRGVGDEASIVEESFSRGLLDFPQYTRPAQLPASEACGPVRKVRTDGTDGTGEAPEAMLSVPPVLVSGDHAEIRRWRKRQAVARTL